MYLFSQFLNRRDTVLRKGFTSSRPKAENLEPFLKTLSMFEKNFHFHWIESRDSFHNSSRIQITWWPPKAYVIPIAQNSQIYKRCYCVDPEVADLSLPHPIPLETYGKNRICPVERIIRNNLGVKKLRVSN